MEERATGATGGGNQEGVANKGGAQSEGISTADDEKELNVDCDAGNAQEGEDTMEAAQARKEAKMKRREERRVAHWQHRRQKRREKKQEIQRLEQEAIARGEQPPERKKKKNPRIRTSVPLEKNHPRLVVDLDFQDFLNEKEIRSVASQINTAYGWIRHHSRPLEMHLTYLKGRVKEAVERNTGSSQWQLAKHEESFIDAFHEQKDKIVYLSPDSPNILETLNPEHIYIIGGIADVHIQKGMTLGKAERLGIQTACLPVKRYTQASRTVLNINHVIEIMTNVAETGDWAAAFAKSMPTRSAYTSPGRAKLKPEEKRNEPEETTSTPTTASAGEGGEDPSEGREGETKEEDAS